jgi:TPR repeat protein
MHPLKPKLAFAMLVLSASLTGCVTGGNLTYKNGPPGDDQWFLKSLIWVAELGPQIGRALTPDKPAKTAQAHAPGGKLAAFESKLATESPGPDLAEYRRLRLNAFLGDVHAPNQVGELYLGGRGVAKNEIEAYAYFNFPRACEHAEANRQRLAGKLSSEDKLRGQQRTRELQKELDWVR